MTANNPLQPDAATLAKIGSLIVHIEEYLSTGGHAFDFYAAQGLMDDPSVQKWLESMRRMAMVPEKRV